MNLLFVEDDPVFARWARGVLELHLPKVRVHHAPSLATARELIARRRPLRFDAALLDLNLGGESGIALIPELVAAAPDLPVLALTAVNSPGLALEAIRAGAQGYLLKAPIAGELVEAVTQLSAGGSPMTPSVARTVLSEFRRAIGSAPPAPAPGRPELPPQVSGRLTPREADVLSLLARGYSNKEAASLLKVAPSTVDTHVRSIYGKLGINSRSQLRRLLG